MEKRNGGRDDFWDISLLVPKKRTPASAGAEGKTGGTDMEISGGEARRRALPRREAASVLPAPLFSYESKGTFLSRVTVYPWGTQYPYYEQFARHAAQLFGREGVEAPFVPFFSYMPQYTQLSREQLSYYLYWRTRFRAGEALPADFSYLLLFLYEVINLGEEMDVAVGQEQMLRLWLSYREKHPRLDFLLREWLCDYSLIHALPAPVLPAGLCRTLIASATLKEFYINAEGGEESLMGAALAFCSNYDYTKSKYFKGDAVPLYHKTLGGAVRVALSFLGEGASPFGAQTTASVVRDAFVGAVCAVRQKRKIKVEYTSFSHTSSLRFLVTDVLKYAENALRARLGVKSRFTVSFVEGELKERLDRYLGGVLPQKGKEEEPDYMRRYDLPRGGALSTALGREIEESSWQTTKRLVEAFGGDGEAGGGDAGEVSFPVAAPRANFPTVSAPDAPPILPPVSPSVAPMPVSLSKREDTANAGESDLAVALGELSGFLPLAKCGSAREQRAFAASKGLMLDAVAERINSAAADLMGDIVLECTDGCYRLIEDYVDWLISKGVLSNGEAE